MAFIHGKHAEVTVGGTSLSAYCDSAELSIDIDSAETTTFGNDWKTQLAGLAGASLSLGGNFDATATVGPAAVFISKIGTASFPVVYYPGGNDAGQISHSFNAVLTGYSESSPVGDKVTFKADLLVDGEVTTATVA